MGSRSTVGKGQFCRQRHVANGVSEAEIHYSMMTMLVIVVTVSGVGKGGHG